MATVEQVRERQEEIAERFQAQPARRGHFTKNARQAVERALHEPKDAKKTQRKRATLPPPSKEAEDFIRRAVSNPNFRGLIERLADE